MGKKEVVWSNHFLTHLKKLTTWFEPIYDSALPKDDDGSDKAAGKAKPFLALNAAYNSNRITDGLADDTSEAEGKRTLDAPYYANQITDGLTYDIWEAECKRTVKAYTDATYQQANPQRRSQPYKFGISQLILSRIRASAG
jgi:hypothetical protein